MLSLFQNYKDNISLFQNYKDNISDLGPNVNSVMFCEIPLVLVSFAAFVAPERLLPTVRPHVALQVTRRSASVVALVTLVWLSPECWLIM